MDKIHQSPHFWHGRVPKHSGDTGPTIPHLAQSPCTVPDHIQRPGHWTWSGTLHSRLGQIFKIFQVSVPNWSQVPGMDVLGPSVHPGTECPLWPNLKYFQVKDPSPLQSPKDGRNPSKSTFLAWTGSQTGWGHWTNYPSLGPVPMYCPRPCPEAWTLDMVWDTPLQARPNFENFPSVSQICPRSQGWTSLVPVATQVQNVHFCQIWIFFTSKILVRSSPPRMDKIRPSPHFRPRRVPKQAGDTGPTIPHLAQSVCTVPDHVQRPGHGLGHSTPG